MKALLFFLLISSGLFTITNEELDKCKGIESFIFGTPKEHFKNITLEIEQGTAQLYTINSDALKINGVQIDNIGISFIRNKLTAISISTKNGTGSAFFKYLKNKYGAPIKTKNQFDWSGKHVNIILELSNNKDAVIDFYSK